MSTVLIDYTSFFYASVARTPVPSAVSGKFVQIRCGGTLYLVLSPKALTKYHGNIIERFCMDQGLEGGYDKDGGKFVITDRAWEVLGGGKFDRDNDAGTITLHGDSTAYGRFDAALLRASVDGLPDLAGLRVMIE